MNGLLDLRAAVRGRHETARCAHDIDAAQSCPAESWAEAAQLGLLGASVPSELGGAGLGLTELCLIGEELAAAPVSDEPSRVWTWAIIALGLGSAIAVIVIMVHGHRPDQMLGEPKDPPR